MHTPHADLLTRHAPFHTDIPLARARAALALVTSGEAHLRSPARAEALGTLRRVREEWTRATDHGARQARTPCPACAAVWVSLVRATDHLPFCPDHPALDRLEVVADALRLLGEGCGAGAGEGGGQDGAGARGDLGDEAEALLAEAATLLGARTPHRWYLPYFDPSVLDGALRKLAGEPPAPLTPREREHLEGVSTEWARAYHPESDPCPHCGVATLLSARLDHLLACPAHPAALQAARLEAAARARLGEGPAAALLGAIGERNALRNALRSLLQGSIHYEAEWGFQEHGVYYSNGDSEDPWLADVTRGERILASPAADVAPPAAVAPTIAAIRAEAARWREALRTLVAACRSLWSGMDEGDRGKSLIPERILPPWKMALEEGTAALARERVAPWRAGGEVAGGRAR